MEILLWTIGKALTLTGPFSDVPLGESASYTLVAGGGSPPYRITRVSSTFPAEWTVPASAADQIVVSVDAATTEGDYSAVFRVKDAERESRLFTRSLRVFSLGIDPCADYTPEAATGATLELGDAAAEMLNVTEATGGTFHLCNEVID